MTVLEMAAVIGSQVTWKVEGMNVPVTVVDVRKVFARIDYLCIPVGGSGEKWISTDRIRGGV